MGYRFVDFWKSYSIKYNEGRKLNMPDVEIINTQKINSAELNLDVKAKPVKFRWYNAYIQCENLLMHGVNIILRRKFV